MRPYANLKELVREKRANIMGMQYFTEHPSQLATLIKEDFDLAERYFANFSQGNINNIVNNARTKNSRALLQHYTFIKGMIEILRIVSSYYYPNKPIKPINKLEEISDDNVLPTIWKDLEYTKFIDSRNNHSTEDKHVYSYNGTEVLYAEKIISQNNVDYVRYKYAGSKSSGSTISDILDDVYAEHQTRHYIKDHLPAMIVKFLEQLEPGNRLDFEFSASNDSFKILAVLQHYDVIAALLRSISPELAMQQLHSSIASQGNRSVLYLVLSRGSLSQHAFTIVQHAIALMQDLKFKDIEAFRTFIRTPKGYDILGELRKHYPSLVNEFLAIDPAFLQNHFTETSKGLPMPMAKVNPDYLPSAPPREDSMRQLPDLNNNSSSAVGAGNTVTLQYRQPEATAKSTQRAFLKPSWI